MHTGHCIINDRRCPLPRRGRKPTDPQPKFFNPRRRHRDLALIPHLCVCNLTFGKEKRKEIVVASIYIELLLRKELLILYLEIEPTLAQIFQPSILWSFMENPAPLYAIFFGKKRNSNYRLRLMQAFARKEVSNYWFCVLKSSRFSPKFFNPRRCHRDLALIPCPCVCNFTFGKKKKEGNSSPCFHLVQAFARK